MNVIKDFLYAVAGVLAIPLALLFVIVILAWQLAHGFLRVLESVGARLEARR